MIILKYFSIFLLVFLCTITLLLPFFAVLSDYIDVHHHFLQFNQAQEYKFKKQKHIKRLLSYRFKEQVAFDYVSVCYVNFYQLGKNFDTVEFLKQYQMTSKEEIEKIKTIDPTISGQGLLSCLNSTQNGDQNHNIAPYFCYHRGFLVRGSIKHQYLMDMNLLSGVKVYIAKDDTKPNDEALKALLLDEKNQRIKMVGLYRNGSLPY